MSDRLPSPRGGWAWRSATEGVAAGRLRKDNRRRITVDGVVYHYTIPHQGDGSVGGTCKTLRRTGEQVAPNSRSTSPSLPGDLDQHPPGAVAVEFPVENLLPRAEVELPPGDGDDDLPPHDLALQVGVGVVLPRAVVMVVVGIRVERGQPLQPHAEVVVQPPLVVVDEDAGGDV